jgi:type VI secretion system secreted protein Hcp
MAVDAFLKLGDLKGESPVKGFEGYIQLLSWSWGMSQSGTAHDGSGAGAGKVSVQDISISKYIDTSTPLLIKAVSLGDHFDTGKLVFRKAGGAATVEYITIDLTEIMISSISTGGSGGEDRFTENISLNFAKYEFVYQAQDKNGAKLGGPIKFKYDIAAVASA